MEFKYDDKEMRQIYCEQLISLAEKDERIVLLEADLMKASGTVAFKDKFPERTFDVGIAEGNMISVAAGLATCGKIPFADTFGTFCARRANDQITISAAYTNLNVKIGGFDPGVTAELNGGTHAAIEDSALMRVMPNMVVYEPVDGTQLKQALPQIVEHQGPCYLRLLRNKKAPVIFDASYKFKLGKADLVKDGADLVIFAGGLMVHKSLEAAAELGNAGINTAVVNLHTLKPLDVDCIVNMAKKCGAVVTAENHSKIGGLGGAVCEALSENYPTPVVRVGINDRFSEVGFMPYLFKALKIDTPDIIEAGKKAVGMKKK